MYDPNNLPVYLHQFIGTTIEDKKIINIIYEPDNIYNTTDGYAGCIYKVFFDIGEPIPFRNFEKEILKKNVKT